MSNPVISPEDAAELQQLRLAYVAAMQRANAALSEHDMDSGAFFEADKEAGQIVTRIKEILGTTGQNSMA